ncbi:hypothetical protein CU097_005024 [Rhizopus azygosporus]|uniref:Uncharacterized protein n=1 Tax=Rhizopus azygosporus TaxID=86630 RepID=A0A367IVZ3_RHIAZ|nr:hypothetical protein CU097_005024 [Rhizopus azygosporus]
MQCRCELLAKLACDFRKARIVRLGYADLATNAMDVQNFISGIYESARRDGLRANVVGAARRSDFSDIWKSNGLPHV